MPAGINRQLKRNKVFSQGLLARRIVAVFDGLKVLCSYSRCCARSGKRPRRAKRWSASSITTAWLGVRLWQSGQANTRDRMAAGGKGCCFCSQAFAAEDRPAIRQPFFRSAPAGFPPVAGPGFEIGWDLVMVLKQGGAGFVQRCPGTNSYGSARFVFVPIDRRGRPLRPESGNRLGYSVHR